MLGIITLQDANRIIEIDVSRARIGEAEEMRAVPARLLFLQDKRL